jgi:hypothetical protein
MFVHIAANTDVTGRENFGRREGPSPADILKRGTAMAVQSVQLPKNISLCA